MDTKINFNRSRICLRYLESNLTSSTLMMDPLANSNFHYTRMIFSPFGLDSDALVVGYVIYEFASRVSNYSFGFFIPILIAALGDEEFGKGKGRIIWGYTTTIISIATVVMYLSCTPLMEFDDWKRISLLHSCAAVSIAHILFIFCFTGPSVIIAILLSIIAKTLQRGGDVAFESFLDVIAINRDPHEISSRSNIMGYSGMLAFILFVAPVVAIIYFGARVHSAVWIEGIIPIVCVGIWYFCFSTYTRRMMPKDEGIGPPMPLQYQGGGVATALWRGLVASLSEQIESIRLIAESFHDLGLFILAFIFLAGATNTAITVGAVLAVNVLQISVIYLLIAFFLGIVASILGVLLFKYLHEKHFLNPKQILIFNMCVLILCILFVLKVETFADVLTLGAVAGSQVGSVGAFTRSILSSLIPNSRQSRLFSFYELTQDGTSWIGPLIISSLAVGYGEGSYRVIVVYVCVVQFAIGLPVLFSVNLSRGLAGRERWERRNEETTTGESERASGAIVAPLSPSTATPVTWE